MDSRIKTVLVTGGAGYVGAVLVPKLLRGGFRVKVLDLYLYGEQALAESAGHPALEEIKGDIRDERLLAHALRGTDAVIHLAGLSNDPSFELDPALGRSVNYDAFIGLVRAAKEGRVRRFIYASTSSVYGIKQEKEVTEELPVEPLTDYSRYKALCEGVLLQARGEGFTVLILRPATVCGYSPRQRLDLVVNIFTSQAVNQRKITVFGGEQMRPNIHIEDLAELYVKCLQWPEESIDGKIFNAGCDNRRLRDIAEAVRGIVGKDIPVILEPADDRRSYRISSEKISRELGFTPRRSVEDAIRDLAAAFEAGRIPDAVTDPRYWNIKTLRLLSLR